MPDDSQQLTWDRFYAAAIGLMNHASFDIGTTEAQAAYLIVHRAALIADAAMLCREERRKWPLVPVTEKSASSA